MRELMVVEYDVVCGGFMGDDAGRGPTSIVDHETARLMNDEKLFDGWGAKYVSLAEGLADICDSHPGVTIKIEETAPSKAGGSAELMGAKAGYNGGGGGSVKIEVTCPAQN